MALCSFFFLIIILLLSPSALLPLGRSSRTKPAVVKLSALKGCLLFHTCTRNTIYQPKHQPRSPRLPASWKLCFSGVLSLVAQRFPWTKQVILGCWHSQPSCVEPVCFSPHLLRLGCFDSCDLWDVQPARGCFKEKKCFCGSGCCGRRPAPFIFQKFAVNVSRHNFLTLFYWTWYYLP